jgi:hypothetical protein
MCNTEEHIDFLSITTRQAHQTLFNTVEFVWSYRMSLHYHYTSADLMDKMQMDIHRTITKVHIL